MRKYLRNITVGARLYELLAEINKECAIILVSHDIGTVLQQVKSMIAVFVNVSSGRTRVLEVFFISLSPYFGLDTSD